jgi:hypothetical protein
MEMECGLDCSLFRLWCGPHSPRFLPLPAEPCLLELAHRGLSKRRPLSNHAQREAAGVAASSGTTTGNRRRKDGPKRRRWVGFWQKTGQESALELSPGSCAGKIRAARQPGSAPQHRWNDEAASVVERVGTATGRTADAAGSAGEGAAGLFLASERRDAPVRPVWSRKVAAQGRGAPGILRAPPRAPCLARPPRSGASHTSQMR